MTRLGLLFGLSLGLSLAAQDSGAGAGAEKTTVENKSASVAPIVASLLGVRRVYVAPLSGGSAADALRALIMDSLAATKLFVITDNPERADATLKGAADDHSFTDTFDSNESIGTRESGGKSSSGSSYSRSSGGLNAALSVNENESHHIKERKHEAYAAVRLCNQDGDVLWSTTQESLGAKFHGASADVAAKIARQLTLDVDRERRGGTAVAAGPATR